MRASTDALPAILTCFRIEHWILNFYYWDCSSRTQRDHLTVRTFITSIFAKYCAHFITMYIKCFIHNYSFVWFIHNYANTAFLFSALWNHMPWSLHYLALKPQDSMPVYSQKPNNSNKSLRTSRPLRWNSERQPLICVHLRLILKCYPAPFWYIPAVVLHATFTLVDIFCKAATERINREKRL